MGITDLDALQDLSADALLRLQQLLKPRLNKYIPYDPTPKQTAFLMMNHVREVLFGGAAGGGKSIAQMMAALQFVDVPGYSAILFRKTYSDLSLPGALISIAKQWLMPFVEIGEVKWSEKEKKFTFPSGATLAFGYLESDNDCYRYQGAEFQYIGFDECTHISPSNYRYLHSRLRKPKSLDVPLRFRATANPGGMYGEYYYTRFFVEGKEKGRVFIGSTIHDNPHLDAEEYIKSLDELDPTTKEQLLHGDWEIKEAGDMFAKDWFIKVPYGTVGHGARRVRFWDLASTDPKKRKAGKGSRSGRRDPDWTAGVKLAECWGMYTIEDIVRCQKTPKEVEEIIINTAKADGYSVAIRMEQEPGSSGDMVIDHYADKLPGYDFKGVRSTGSKVERAGPVSSAAQSGKIHMTDNCRNAEAFLDEASLFPYGAHDDMVDAVSGAYSHFRKAVMIAAPQGTGRKNAKSSYWKKI